MNDDHLDMPSFVISKAMPEQLPRPSRTGRQINKDTVQLFASRKTPVDIDLGAEATTRTVDAALANELVHLISSLEQDRVRLRSLVGRNRPDQALQVLGDMVSLVGTLAGKRLDPQAGDASLVHALHEADDFRVALKTAQKRLAPSVLQHLLGLLGRAAAGPTRGRKQLRLLRERGLTVLQDLFTLFKAGFASPEPAEEWEQTSAPFLAELTDVLNQVAR